MKTYFKDTTLQKRFDRDGFVILDGMIDGTQMDALIQLFKSIEPPDLNRMYCNIYNRTPEENEQIDKTLVSAFTGSFEHHFKDCRILNGVFLAKGNGPQTASIIHQDWNSVDEEHFESLALWMPLEDVDETNGCIYVIKGSHRIFNTVRSLTIPTLYLDFDAELEPYLTPVPMKAGQTLVYAHNLFHGSKPKYAGGVRAAVVIGVVPRDARTIYYFRDTANPELIELFETNTEFYLNGISKYLDQKRPSDLRKVGELRGNKFTITKEDFFETLRKQKSSDN